MADRLQRRRRRRKRALELAVTRHGRAIRWVTNRGWQDHRPYALTWALTYGCFGPPMHQIALYDTVRPTDGR